MGPRISWYLKTTTFCTAPVFRFLVLHTFLMFLKLQTICNENDAANYGFKITRRNDRLY